MVATFTRVIPTVVRTIGSTRDTRRSTHASCAVVTSSETKISSEAIHSIVNVIFNRKCNFIVLPLLLPELVRSARKKFQQDQLSRRSSALVSPPRSPLFPAPELRDRVDRRPGGDPAGFRGPVVRELFPRVDQAGSGLVHPDTIGFPRGPLDEEDRVCPGSWWKAALLASRQPSSCESFFGIQSQKKSKPNPRQIV